MPAVAFSDRLLDWFNKYGRHDLPWQFDRTPYRVWVSEIMLQQTQVITVIPYYRRFIKRFPDVKTLAAAKLDDVLYYWTGLGYYARARNLYKTAIIIVNDHAGRFPQIIDTVVSLPGISRSTAGAILSLACAKRHPILDGNVKRVLSRYHAIQGWPGKQDVAARLWSYAEQHTPLEKVDDYTQAIMDLGATICKRRNPNCDDCPLAEACIAKKMARQHDLPSSKPKINLPKREAILAIIENSRGEILLEKRPSTGIWGGLWCFPEMQMDESIASVVQKQYGYKIKKQVEYKNFKHTFSHFHLMIRPIHIKLGEQVNSVKAAGSSTWLDTDAPINLGFPAPVVSLLENLNKNKGVLLNES